jgi:ankyrin repeat protein
VNSDANSTIWQTGISEANERNNEGDSAFLTTARTSSVECAELLLAHGASLNDKDEHGTNALMYAASGKNPEVCILRTRAAGIDWWLTTVWCRWCGG